MCAIHQAKKFREFGINENLGQGNVVSGATLNDRANDGRRFINSVVHQRDGNWNRARRDQPIDRFDEFFGAGHVNSLRLRVQVLHSPLCPLSRSRITWALCSCV